MARTKTVFVIGAGAGDGCGLPLGSVLMDDVAKRTDLKWEGGNLVAGDGRLSSAIELAHEVAKRTSSENEQKLYRDATRSISDGLVMGTYASIDDYIGVQGDRRITEVAKIAVTRSILECERNSQLVLEKKPDTLVRTNVRTTWLPLLCRLLFTCPLEEVEKRLSTFTLINFNYDRVIKHVLHNALQVHYRGVSAADATRILKSLKIIHPYGHVGRLLWEQEPGPKVPFGADADTETLLTVARGLRTMSEGSESSDMTDAHERLRECERLVFLGFGFLESNMQLLSYPERLGKRTRACFGTSFGVSDHNRGVYKDDIKRLLPAYSQEPELRRLKCDKLLAAYWETLAR